MNYPASSPQPPTLDVVGWQLDAARSALTGSTPSQKLRVVETSAPPRKIAQHTYGDWRVLRVVGVNDETGNSILELTVARELLEHARRES